MAQLSIRDKALEVLLAWLVFKQAVKNSAILNGPTRPGPMTQSSSEKRGRWRGSYGMSGKHGRIGHAA